MANEKISQLPSATTPLAGTEVLPIVQGGVTVKVSAADVTAGRAVSASSLTLSTALAVTSGGTGQTSYTNGQLLIGNTAGNTLTKATLTAGTNISITNGTGSITINSTDQFVGTVTSVALSGGTTGLTVSGSPITTSGTITLAGTLAVANGGTGVTTSTGTGSVALSTSPTFVTPTLGAASATSIANGLGAVGTPSYTFTGNLNTGVWSPAADTIAFSEGGVEAMRINASGNVGIGTIAPVGRLNVAAADTSNIIGSSTASINITNTDAGATGRTSNLNFTVDDGNIATRRLAAISAVYTSFDSGTTSGALAFATHGAGTLNEQMRISSAGNINVSTGNLVIGTAAKGIDFSVNTSAPGMTSEILNDYEQGAWTPTGNGITYAAGTAGEYTKIGNLVICTFNVVFPVTSDSSPARVAGLPYASGVTSAATFGLYTSGFNGSILPTNSYIALITPTNSAFVVNSTLSGQTFAGSIVYQVV